MWMKCSCLCDHFIDELWQKSQSPLHVFVFSSSSCIFHSCQTSVLRSLSFLLLKCYCVGSVMWGWDVIQCLDLFFLLFFSPHSALLKKLIRLLLSPPPFSEQLFTLGALIRAKMLCKTFFLYQILILRKHFQKICWNICWNIKWINYKLMEVKVMVIKFLRIQNCFILFF